jgi:hypothetical protein
MFFKIVNELSHPSKQELLPVLCLHQVRPLERTEQKKNVVHKYIGFGDCFAERFCYFYFGAGD